MKKLLKQISTSRSVVMGGLSLLATQVMAHEGHSEPLSLMAHPHEASHSWSIILLALTVSAVVVISFKALQKRKNRLSQHTEK